MEHLTEQPSGSVAAARLGDRAQSEPYNLDPAVDALRSVKADQSLSAIEKRMQTAQIKRHVFRDIKKRFAERDQIDRNIAALDDFIQWGRGDDYKLEKNDCSRLHRLADAFKVGRVFSDNSEPVDDGSMAMVVGAQPFVVAHDWAGVVGHSDETAGDISLPFEHCAFEFRFGGRNIVVIALQPPDAQPVIATAFFETTSGDWLVLGESARDDEWAQQWWYQVRAICIMLDAEVATRSVVRAPAALNKKRERAGATPLYDYHVVDLSHRHRLASRMGVGAGSRKRLHFCRGHWRHYESHKTWIRWCLKGDADLGFVDKEYAL